MFSLQKRLCKKYKNVYYIQYILYKLHSLLQYVMCFICMVNCLVIISASSYYVISLLLKELSFVLAEYMVCLFVHMNKY